MLEVARLIVDSGWIPPRPIIFLFNGAEELFMLVRCYRIILILLGPSMILSLKRTVAFVDSGSTWLHDNS